MSNGIRESRGKREARRDGGLSRMAMGFAMVVVIALAVAALLFLFA